MINRMGRTFFIDIDGTLVRHKTAVELDNMIETPINEELLPGVLELWDHFEIDDCIVITTARRNRHRGITERIFKDNNLRYNMMLFELESGPRILINDTPNISVQKASAINVRRNGGFYFDEDDSRFKNEKKMNFN